MEYYYIPKGSSKIIDFSYILYNLCIIKIKDLKVYGMHRRSNTKIEFVKDKHYSISEYSLENIKLVPTSDKIGFMTVVDVVEDTNNKKKNKNRKNTNLKRKAKPVKYIIPSFPVILDCDADCDGTIGYNEKGKSNWKWGSDKPGAILLANNNLDIDGRLQIPYPGSEYGNLVLRSTGISSKELEKNGLELRLFATPRSAERFSIYRLHGDNKLKKILGVFEKKSEKEIRNISGPLNSLGDSYNVEAHEHPRRGFDGIITIELQLRQMNLNSQSGPLLVNDRVVFRIAPWIMIPNTEPVECVYSRENPIYRDNREFLRKFNEIFSGSDIKTICMKDNGQWIQDQWEIGYTQAPYHTRIVAFESPSKGVYDKELKKEFRKQNHGYFRLGDKKETSLDSFGNLEVSPPVTVRGKKYPLGRIIFGGRAYGGGVIKKRDIMPELRHFLYAQKVQSPIEVYTDWLYVGHVDEIINFIPFPENIKKFKILLASPKYALKTLNHLKNKGYGNALMFKNKMDETGEIPRQTTVSKMLKDVKLWENNHIYQEYMNLNRAILKKHLDMEDSDFIDIPVIFNLKRDKKHDLEKSDRAEAIMPNMVNHLVVNDFSIVPDPHGPIVNINGKEIDFFKSLFICITGCRNTIFIDDWEEYHLYGGEIHCCTNALRKITNEFKWWKFRPDSAYDI